MKKLLLSALLVALTFVSCDSDDSPSTDNSALLGKWQLTAQVDSPEPNATLSDCEKQSTLEFKEDTVISKGFEDYNDECESYESTDPYSVSGNTISVESEYENEEGGTETETNTAKYKVIGDVLTITFEFDLLDDLKEELGDLLTDEKIEDAKKENGGSTKVTFVSTYKKI